MSSVCTSTSTGSRRCICSSKYVSSKSSAKSSKGRKKKKRIKFPRPLQLTHAQRIAKLMAERAAKLALLPKKPKLPFPDGKPQMKKLSGLSALAYAAALEAEKARRKAAAALRAKLKGRKFDLYGKKRGKGGKGGKRRRKKKGKGKKKRYPWDKGSEDEIKWRNIKITYPPFRTETWIPPYLLPWPPRIKIHIDQPPFNTRKWIPPYLRKKRLRPKIMIDYPPLSFRKWIPPYLRKRKPRAKLISLHGRNFHIDPSTLTKYWYHFRFLDDWYGIINGDYSQTHKRYNYKTNGLQAPCNCMVAMTISKLFKMKHWHRNFLNGLLDLGNSLYLETLRHLPHVPPDVPVNIKVEEVHKSFYFGRTKITMTLSSSLITGKVFKDYEGQVYLRKAIKSFFKKYYSGILIIKKKYRAVWKQGGKYFLFDPTEHDEAGHTWEGIPGLGFCFVAMFLSTEKMIDFVHDRTPDDANNFNFTLIPCDILRTNEVVTDYPNCLLEFEEEQKKPIPRKDLDRLLPPPPEIVEEVEEEEDPQWIELDEVAEEAIPEGVPARKTKIKEPILKPKAESVTYFTALVPAKQGILRASTYQTDPKFSKYKGHQTLANAVAALTMLRMHKAKKWTSHILDNVLRTGEIIYHDSKSKKYKQESLKFEHITNKITIEEKEFTPVFEEMQVLGKLQTTVDVLLDLLPAVREYFSDNAMGIISGPLTLAVWFEDGYYYMFDPDERDANGNAIIRTIEVGSEIIFKDIPPGRACVTWYADLEDLVERYMKNADKYHRRDYFSICKVEIKDYVPTYPDWNNFKALSDNKWILRGSLSQSSKRFEKESRNTQCTAMAALALGFTKLELLKDWTTETVDQIILEGDIYYNSCVQTLKDAKKYLSRMLLVEELQRNYKIGDKEISFDIDDCMVNGVISMKEEPNYKNLVQGLNEFFENNDNGILTAKSLSVAVWKFKDIFYTFDSHTRNEQGLRSNAGNACVLRFINLTDMGNCIEANFGVDTSSFYNISRVEPTVTIVTGDGQVLPPLKSYMQIDDVMAILRASISDTAKEFEFNRGKQVTANCVVAAGMASLYPPIEWTTATLDKILRDGDKLYAESQDAAYLAMLNAAKLIATKPAETGKKGEAGGRKGRRGGGHPLVKDSNMFDQLPDSMLSRLSGFTRSIEMYNRKFFRRAGGFPLSMEVDPLAVDLKEDISSENVLTNFKVGVNSIELVFELINQGPIESDLEQRLIKFLQEPPVDDKDKKEVLLETDHVTYYIFKDSNVFFLFTSQPCDHEGCFFGREEWTVPPPPIEEQEEEELLMTEMSEEAETEEEGQLENIGDELEINQYLYDMADEEEEETEDIGFKHSSHYWKQIADKEGKAFIAWFSQPEYLAQHVMLNFPEEIKKERYSLKKIMIKSIAQVKDFFDPKTAERVDPYDGDFYDFKEIERGRWILRGTHDQTYEMFPEKNRGLQTIANCFTALAFFHLYHVKTFKPITIDNILKYGDRLLTFTKNLRRKGLRENKEVRLTESQIDEVLEGETFGISDIFRTFSLGEEQVTFEIEEYLINGEINAEETEEILNVLKGVTQFYEENKFGILCAKDLCVALVKGGKMYYMFDPQSRGPSGIKCTNGVACITRFMEIEPLTKLFLQNLVKEGKNSFAIHKVTLTKKKVEIPPPPPLPDMPPDVALVGYSVVVPGKRIVRGTFSQEDPRFGRGENVQSATIALVALAMSLIHRCANWTKPLIDEIVLIGDEVYGKALDKLGFSFNPWEQALTLEYVPPDFIIGDLKANCELRDTTQTGIFGIKDPKISNLRQGIERFFDENTHGVVESVPFTAAIWEDDYEKLIYMFDPNPRGPTGMPLMVNGAACLMGFKDAKMASEHIISLLGDRTNAEFVIIPVEIIIGKNQKKCRKLAKTVRKTHSTLELIRKQNEIRKQKQDKRLALLGRCAFYQIPGTEIATLRGTRSQNNKVYSPNSRNNQDIPNCMTAFVMERLLPLNKWTSKIIDQILDIGDQLYKDCFVLNSPTCPKIGLEFVIRQVIIKDVKVHVAICKPVIINEFTYDNVVNGLTIYFTQKQFCLLETRNQWVAIFFRDDNYYLFDPHDRNLLGEVSDSGTAVLIKHLTIESVVKQIYDNYYNGESEVFQVILLGIKGIEKYEQEPCRCGVDVFLKPPLLY